MKKIFETAAELEADIKAKRLAKIDRMLDKNLAKLNGQVASTCRPSKLRQRITELQKEREDLTTPELFSQPDGVTVLPDGSGFFVAEVPSPSKASFWLWRLKQVFTTINRVLHITQ